MEPNPYRAPGTPNPSAPDDTPGPLWKAVLYGVLVDVGGTILLGVIVVFLTGSWMAAHGATQAEIEDFFRNMPGLMTPFGLVSAALGTAMSVLAGYVCARTARTRVYKAALASALITAGLTTLLGAGGHETLPVTLLEYIVGIVAVLAGAWLYARRRPEASADGGFAA